MSRLLCTLEGREVRQDEEGRVYFTADADIDADGANGQSLHPHTNARLFAYAPQDRGLDLLANAGYPHGAFRDILVCGSQDEPIKFPPSGYYSRTAYFRAGRSPFDPDRYLDSCAVPYIVVENFIRRRAKGVVLGCKARVTNLRNQQTVECVVGDIGPLRSIGELSIAAADAIGIKSNPRSGGQSSDVLYELWPGLPAVVNGETFDLIRFVPA